MSADFLANGFPSSCPMLRTLVLGSDQSEPPGSTAIMGLRPRTAGGLLGQGDMPLVASMTTEAGHYKRQESG